jgi:hypothetical protein
LDKAWQRLDDDASPTALGAKSSAASVAATPAVAVGATHAVKARRRHLLLHSVDSEMSRHVEHKLPGRAWICTLGGMVRLGEGC